MLILSDAVAGAFLSEGLQKLHRQIVSGWLEKLRRSYDDAGEAERNRILADVERMAREDPSLTTTELNMLADLMLVDAANERRKAGAAG